MIFALSNFTSLNVIISRSIQAVANSIISFFSLWLSHSSFSRVLPICLYIHIPHIPCMHHHTAAKPSHQHTPQKHALRLPVTYCLLQPKDSDDHTTHEIQFSITFHNSKVSCFAAYLLLLLVNLIFCLFFHPENAHFPPDLPWTPSYLHTLSSAFHSNLYANDSNLYLHGRSCLSLMLT